jgi:hypothetical protein
LRFSTKRRSRSELPSAKPPGEAASTSRHPCGASLIPHASERPSAIAVVLPNYKTLAQRATFREALRGEAAFYVAPPPRRILCSSLSHLFTASTSRRTCGASLIPHSSERPSAIAVVLPNYKTLAQRATFREALQGGAAFHVAPPLRRILCSSLSHLVTASTSRPRRILIAAILPRSHCNRCCSSYLNVAREASHLPRSLRAERPLRRAAPCGASFAFSLALSTLALSTAAPDQPIALH